MTSSISRGALTALAVALLAAPALAQTPPPPAGGRWGADHQRMHDMMEQHRAAMARDLHAILNIRPDQEGAFAAFQAAEAPPPRDQRMTRDRQAMMTMTTPQKLDMMLAKMDERMARLRARAQATKAFYAALSPQQQSAFDALMRMHGGGRWGGHEGKRRGGPGEGAPPPGE